MNRKALLRIGIIAAAFGLIAVASWATKYHLVASSAVPAATGNVDVHQDKNGNTAAEIKVEHLARPSQLTPPATAYVVWFVQEGSPPVNEGELKVGDDLKGEFKTTTPLKNFEIRITAENDPMTKTMSGPLVMRATVQG
jgi:hypothetical protein